MLAAKCFNPLNLINYFPAKEDSPNYEIKFYNSEIEYLFSYNELPKIFKNIKDKNFDFFNDTYYIEIKDVKSNIIRHRFLGKKFIDGIIVPNPDKLQDLFEVSFLDGPYSEYKSYHFRNGEIYHGFASKNQLNKIFIDNPGILA